MARVRDFLDRFRPAGAPGAASLVGVPSDRRESVVAELEPVFAVLESVVRRCDQIRRDAQNAGGKRESAAAELGRAVISRARAESAAERARASAGLREEAATAGRQTLLRAESQAAEIRRADDARRPELVARAIDIVRADLVTFAAGGNEST